jgi:5,10-methylenetetrahydromethanopterin reductase
MRVGLHIGPMHDFRPIDEILDFVKRSEGLGFDPILFADSVSLSRFHVHDPYTLLALASRITAKATIGTCVTNPLTRHLSVTTNAAGSIDDISGGRMLLGVGTGDTAVHLIGKKAVRLSTMRESLTVLKKLLSGESVDFEGQALASNWRKPDLPVYLAAGGPKTLALGGELADGLITLAGLSPETIEWVRGCVAEGEAAAGKPKGSVPVWIDGLLSFGEDREKVRRAIKPRITSFANQNFRVAYHAVPEEFLPEARAFRENYDETDLGPGTENAKYVTDFMIDRFGIVGTTSDVVSRFEGLAEMNVETFLVAMPFRLEKRIAIIEMLGREVLPRIG